MTTYQQYKEQIAELEKLAKTARQSELAQAKQEIHSIMQEFGLKLADLGEVIQPKPHKERAKVQAKYHDGNGNMWTGRGRAPKWLEGKDRNQFLIT